MKRILLGAFSQMLTLGAFGSMAGPSVGPRGKARKVSRQFEAAVGRTSDARDWHDPTDFHQSNRLEAAVLKRRRKAEKLQRDTLEAATNNWAHVGGRRCDLITASPIGSLNPFYIAK